jgi:hypothetical protein
MIKGGTKAFQLNTINLIISAFLYMKISSGVSLNISRHFSPEDPSLDQ